MKKIISLFTPLMLLLGIVISPQLHAEHAVSEFKNIEWAKPKGFALTADIYVPKTGKKQYPVLIIYHGGGWLINKNTIMNDMSQYIASHSDIAVVNMNYRLLPDNNNTTKMNEIVEDVLGGVLWVKDNIKQYGGSPNAIAVTGDSAGGHLTAMVVLASKKLESDGYAGTSLGFNPSYLPANKTAEDILKNNGASIQAAILSYPAVDIFSSAQGGFEKPSNMFWTFAKSNPRGIFGSDITVEKNPEFYKAVSPIYLVPKASDNKLPPQFVLVGSQDPLTTPASVGHYVDLLKAANQPVEFKIYEGKGHGYLDSGCNEYTRGCFKELATPTLDDMIVFLNKTLK